MIVILSPAKRIDTRYHKLQDTTSDPVFMTEANKLVKELQKLKPSEFMDLMDINPQLTALNIDRFQSWRFREAVSHSYHALLIFRGEEIKMVPILAKRARGLMTRFIIKNRIHDAEDLKGFDSEDYFFQE